MLWKIAAREEAELSRRDGTEEGCNEDHAAVHLLWQCDVGLHQVAREAAAPLHLDHDHYRTNKDKRQAVTRALTDEEWGEYSDQIIAEYCAVSRQLVSKVRQELIEAGEIEGRDSALGKDGRRQATKKGGTNPRRRGIRWQRCHLNGTSGEDSEDSRSQTR